MGAMAAVAVVGRRVSEDRLVGIVAVIRVPIVVVVVSRNAHTNRIPLVDDAAAAALPSPPPVNCIHCEG